MGEQEELSRLVQEVAAALVAIDQSGVAHKGFHPGVGPYGEPQLVRAIAEHLGSLPAYAGAKTKRHPDLLLPGTWALEFKLVRPFGDNGKQAENWSVNVLHPYRGNVSLLGDCLKLQALGGPERKAAIAIGYAHTPPQIHLEPLLSAFELLARDIVGVALGERVETTRAGLCHPVHQELTVAAWEVLPVTHVSGS